MLDPLFKIESSSSLDSRIKRSIGLKIKNVLDNAKSLETASGLKYPPCYVDPALRVVQASGNVLEGLGVLYARTIPMQSDNKVTIVVELAAPLVLYGTKATLKLVMAHELLHYIELARNFMSMNVTSEITASTVFEERFIDSSRAIAPSLVFKNKRFARNLAQRTSTGFDDPKLNEKCRVKWIEKGLPTFKIPMGSNQVIIPVGSILLTEFDPRIRQIISSAKLAPEGKNP